MALVKFEQRSIPVVDQNGLPKWSPAIRLANGDFIPISHQGEILIYDTKEESDEYFEQ